MIPIGSKLGKTALILTLTTLVIGFGASASFNLPDDTVHDSDVLVAAHEFSDSSQIDYVELEYEGPDGNSGVAGQMTDEGSGNYSYTFDKDSDGSDSEGDYVLQAFAYNSSDSELDSTDELTVTLDASGPDVSVIDEDDSDYVSDDPEITYDISDEYSYITDVSVSADSDDGDVSADVSDDCDGESECQADVDVDTSDLDDGDEFSIDLTATDEAGNDGSGGGSFQIDDSYDGDSSADIEWDVSGETTLVGNGDEDQDVLISFQPDTVSETTVFCLVDGEDRDEATDTDTLDASDEEEEASCEFDSGEYAGSVFDLTVEVEDAAGNEDTVVEDQEMVWDERAPAITTIENPNDISTFNDNFEVSVTATDDASGVENLEYYFDSGTEEGNGNSVDLDQAGSTAIDSTFEISPDLGQGNHTVFVRARDGTNQWSDQAEFEFEYFPDRDPEVDLQAPESVEVTSGETTSFTLTIENGAPFFLNGVEVNSDSVLWNGSVSASNLEEGDSVEKTVNIDASGLEPDVYNLSLETASMDDSTTVEVVVRATGSQQSEIQQQVDSWASKMEELDSNVSSLGNLKVDNQRILEGNVSEFKQKVQNAQSAVESGEYYRAKSHLRNIDTEFQEASSTFSDVRQDYRQKQTNQYIMYTFIAVLVLGGGTAGFLLYREEELIGDSMDLNLPELGMVGSLPNLGISEKLSGLFEDEEEEEEVGYSFEDFT